MDSDIGYWLVLKLGKSDGSSEVWACEEGGRRKLAASIKTKNSMLSLLYHEIKLSIINFVYGLIITTFNWEL